MNIDHGPGNETANKEKALVAMKSMAGKITSLSTRIQIRTAKRRTTDGRMTRAGKVVGDKGLEPLTSPV